MSNCISPQQIKELRKQIGFTQKEFSEYFKIPFRTVQNWEYGKSPCSEYLFELIVYKLKNEKIIE